MCNDDLEEQLKRIYFTQHNVHQMMVASQKLYADHFAGKCLPLMIQELYPWLPPGKFSTWEAAGLVFGHAAINPMDQSANDQQMPKTDSNLIIMPLVSLVEHYLLAKLDEPERKPTKTSIIVTAQGHTVCYMCSENGQLFVFDPLPASLTSIPMSRIHEDIFLQFRATSNMPAIEYSALIMKLKPPHM